MNHWIPLDSEEQLQEAIRHSFSPESKGFGIIKHSTRCNISSMALNRLEGVANPAFPIYYLDLLRYRNISNWIAEYFQVEHESPQLLLIKDGKCCASASHTAIRAEMISKPIG